MATRGGRSATSTDTNGGQRHRRGRTDVQHGTPPQLWLEHLWLPVAEHCVHAGTLQVLPESALLQLQAALIAATDKPQQLRSKQAYTAAAQLLVLASHDCACFEPGANREVLRVIAFAVHCLLKDVKFAQALAEPQEPQSRPAQCLAQRLVARAQLPQLGAQQLAAASLQLGVPCSSDASVPHSEHQPGPGPSQLQAAMPASSTSNSSGSAGPSALAAAMGLCSTYSIMAQGMLPYYGKRTSAVATLRSMHSLAASQLLDHLARTLMAAAAASGSSSASAAAFAGQLQLCGRAAPASVPAAVARVHTQPPVWSSSLQDNATRLDYALALALTAAETVGKAGDAGSVAEDTCPDLAATTLRFIGYGTCYSAPLVRSVLGAPGLQYYVAARMVQTLCAVDGGPSWGMPQVPLPLPDVSSWGHPEGRPTRDARSMAFADFAGAVLLAGLGHHQRQPQPAALQQQQQQQRGIGAVPVQPVRPGGAFRIALRSLEWALQQAPGSGAAAGPHRTCRMSRSTLMVVMGMLPVAMVALRAGAPAKAASRLQELLPLAVAAMADVCDEDSDITEAGAHDVMTLVLRMLLNVVLEPRGAKSFSWMDDTAIAGMSAALGSGLLPALQAAAAWLTPERIAADKATNQPFSSIANLFYYVSEGMPHWLRLDAPEAAAVQPAALVASVRSTFTGAFAVLLDGHAAVSRPRGIAVTQHLELLLQRGLMHLLLGPDGTGWATPPPPALLAAATFALVQWGPCLQRTARTHVGTQAAEDRSLRGASGKWCSTLVPIAVAARACEMLAAELGAAKGCGDPGAAGPAGASATAPCRASHAARLASWRRLLLRELRALDTLGLMWRLMDAYEGWSDSDLAVMLATLQAVARALPDDLQRHLESARGQPEAHTVQSAAHHYVFARSRQHSMPGAQPSECGLAWLPLGEQAVPALAEGRFDDLELPRGRKAHPSTGAEACYLSSIGEKAAAWLPAPCEVAALLPTCDNPMCSTQACYLAAGRGGPLPALRPCPKCGQARYCSKGCQKAHWDAHHGFECGKGWWEPKG